MFCPGDNRVHDAFVPSQAPMACEIHEEPFWKRLQHCSVEYHLDLRGYVSGFSSQIHFALVVLQRFQGIAKKAIELLAKILRRCWIPVNHGSYNQGRDPADREA